jgi:hypothetical protein
MRVITKVERTLERVFRLRPSARGTREPLEIRRALLRELTDEVQPKGRGEFVFPYRSVRIRVFAGDDERAQKLGAVLDAESFRSELKDELAASGAERASFDLEITVTPDQGEEDYRIEYPAEDSAVPASPVARPAARLTVRTGSANSPSFEITSDTVLIGRMAEVVELNTGRTRQNDIAFDEKETTISRKHARIAFDTSTGFFRVFDEPNSREGTFLLRAGTPDVKCDSKRGIRLRSGDEIRVGRARILFELL